MSQLFQRLNERAKTAKHPAIIENETVWSYSDLIDKINRLANYLKSNGIQASDRVAVMLMNQKEFIVSLYALRRIGAVMVPINIQMPPNDIRYVLLNSGSKMIITNAQFAPNFTGLPFPLLVTEPTEEDQPSFEAAINSSSSEFSESEAKTNSDNLDLLLYTSGTTGNPKGVMLSEANLIANLEGIHPLLNFIDTDKVLLALPLFHAYGLMIGLYALDVQGELVLVPNFSPKKILEALAEQKITVLPLVPTMFSVLLHAMEKTGPEPYKALKYCVSGGASLPAELLKKIEAFLNITVLEGYGLTETSPVLCVNDPKVGSIPGSVGKPLCNVEIKLAEDGEILAKGPNVMKGYYNLPEETASVFDENGYFKTGDLGRFDEAGNLYISGGRKKDLIIKAGENISPLQIEQVLYQHPAIMDASVIGVPDAKLGESILACVQLKPEVAEEKAEIAKTLKKFCQEHLTSFYVPDRFEFYDELPKNATGKVLKKILKEQHQTAAV